MEKKTKKMEKKTCSFLQRNHRVMSSRTNERNGDVVACYRTVHEGVLSFFFARESLRFANSVSGLRRPIMGYRSDHGFVLCTVMVEPRDIRRVISCGFLGNG